MERRIGTITIIDRRLARASVILDRTMCNLVLLSFSFLFVFFFSVSKAKSSGVFVEKFDAFSRFSMVVSSITCTVRRDRSKEVKTQVKKIAEMARLTRTFLFIMYKRKNKKKEKKNLKKTKWANSMTNELILSSISVLSFFFFFFFFFSVVRLSSISYFLCTCFVLLVSSPFFFFSFFLVFSFSSFLFRHEEW